MLEWPCNDVVILWNEMVANPAESSEILAVRRVCSDPRMEQSGSSAAITNYKFIAVCIRVNVGPRNFYCAR